MTSLSLASGLAPPLRQPITRVAAGVVLAVLLAALLAPWLVARDPNAMDLNAVLQPRLWVPRCVRPSRSCWQRRAG